MTINSVIDEAVSGIHAMDARRKIFSEKLLLLKDEDLAPLNDRELLEDRLILPVHSAQAFSKRVSWNGCTGRSSMQDNITQL